MRIGALHFCEQVSKFIFSSSPAFRAHGQHAAARVELDFGAFSEVCLFSDCLRHSDSKTVAPFLHSCRHRGLSCLYNEYTAPACGVNAIATRQSVFAETALAYSMLPT